MLQGRKTQVVLLDERHLDIVIQPRLAVEELLNIVASHCRLKDPDKKYFGLAFVDEKSQYHWLLNEKMVLDHDFARKMMLNSTLVLHHSVRFYIESVAFLTHSSTVELYFIHSAAWIHRGLASIDNDTAFLLAALYVQICCGDYTDDQSALNSFKRLSLFNSKILQDFLSISTCEVKVLALYRSLAGVSRGQAIFQYMQCVENLPTYGVHFYFVTDKMGVNYCLGISKHGLYQYDASNRTSPIRIFHWKQLENLYYHDKKFSVEIHESKRTRNLSKGLLHEGVEHENDTENSRSFSNRLLVPKTSTSEMAVVLDDELKTYVFYCSSASICKAMWSLAIAQHQFYLDRKAFQSRKNLSSFNNTVKLTANMNHNLYLVKSSAAVGLSSRLTSTNRSTSDSGLSVSSQSVQSMPLPVVPISDDKAAEDNKAKRALLMDKKFALEKLLASKLKELKTVCIEEATLTGCLPVEIKQCLAPGEQLPKFQKRVGTSFVLSIDLPSNLQSSRLSQLESDVEVQRKIVSAALKLASDCSMNKVVLKKRRREAEMAQDRLNDLNQKLMQLRLGTSKPELTIKTKSVSASELSKNGVRSAKSAPTTPHGSTDNLISNVSSKSTIGNVCRSIFENVKIGKSTTKGRSAPFSPSVQKSKPSNSPVVSKQKNRSTSSCNVGHWKISKNKSSGSRFLETSKPFETADVLKYHEMCSSVNRNSHHKSSSHLHSVNSLTSDRLNDIIKPHSGYTYPSKVVSIPERYRTIEV